MIPNLHGPMEAETTCDDEMSELDVSAAAWPSAGDGHAGLGDASEAEVDDLFLAETTPSLEVATPRQRRAVAQPLRLDSQPHVVCYLYQHTVAGSSSSWQGHAARLCFFLPENWSPAYKFTVFEDSYVVQFDEDTVSSDGTEPFHLARPLHTRRHAREGGEDLAEFELVWPMPVDRIFLDAVQRACETVVPGAKRKPRHALSLSTVHLKLQKLYL